MKYTPGNNGSTRPPTAEPLNKSVHKGNASVDYNTTAPTGGISTMLKDSQT